LMTRNPHETILIFLEEYESNTIYQLVQLDEKKDYTTNTSKDDKTSTEKLDAIDEMKI
ncbi:unnamed protein product, partial [Rotaria magnacalcarata]